MQITKRFIGLIHHGIHDVCHGHLAVGGGSWQIRECARGVQTRYRVADSRDQSIANVSLDVRCWGSLQTKVPILTLFWQF